MKKDRNELFLKSLDAKVKKAIFNYNLFNDDDRIMIALSGGKDSLALVELLGRRSKILFPRIHLFAVHIIMDNIPYYSDIEYLQFFCASYNIPLKITKCTLDITTNKEKTPCFLCSWNRRKVIFETAKEYNCNKIALGHHQDDILETLLMNMTFQGAFSTMPPFLQMKKFDMAIVRPLCLVAEKEIHELAKMSSYKEQIKKCPYETKSFRSDFKKIISLLETLNPHVRRSMWSAMNNIQKDYLP